MFSTPLFLYPPSSTAGPLTQRSAECFRVIIVVTLLRRAGEREMRLRCHGGSEMFRSEAAGPLLRLCIDVSIKQREQPTNQPLTSIDPARISLSISVVFVAKNASAFFTSLATVCKNAS